MASSSGNTVDAVTSATSASPRAHHVSWDCSDIDGVNVAAGSYVMNVEFATDNSSLSGATNPSLQVPFQVGQGSETIKPADAPYFTGIVLTYR